MPDITAPVSDPIKAPTPAVSYQVKGVIAEGGKGLASATVTLYWQQLRARVQLATGQSSDTGEYELTYTPPANPAGKVLVVVEAKTTTGAAPVTSSTVALASELKINLDFQPDDSEYTGLLLAITPLLGALHLTDLVESDQNQDISYLAKQASRPNTQVLRLVVASLLEAANGIAAPVFYAFLRLNLPSSLPPDLLAASQGFKTITALISQIASEILALDASVQQQTLETAIARKYIADSFTAQLPAILQQFEAKRYANALNRPYGGGQTPLGLLLALSSLTGDKLTAMAQALVKNTQPMSAFWQTLSDGQHGFTPAEAASAELVMELGSFVQNQLPVVKTLLARIQSGTAKTIADLAALTEKDWEAIITQSGAGAVPDDVAADGATTALQVFAGQIYALVTQAYPTTSLASRIGQGTMVPEAQRAPLTAFFAAHGDLDLLTTNLDAWLAQQGAAAFTGIAAADQPGVIANLKRFQRVLQIATNVDTALILLGLGLDSAAKIAALGERQFVARSAAAGMASADSESIYANAEHQYASTLSLLSQNHAGLRNVWPAALGDNMALNTAISQAVQAHPNLTALFGSQDYCAVDPATSVLSPGAYLADLLLWLRQRDPAAAYSTLRARRPDIMGILLNSPNSFTPLPYIDLVNELLEDAVAAPKTPVSKQTAAALTAEDLRAAPQFVNADAYVTLAAANFPHMLPYDGPLDELRTTLLESKVALWHVRQSLEPLHGSVPAAQAASTAAERFKISAHELQLITTANFVPLTTAWGTADPVKDLANVAVFLQQAGLTYEQLPVLLQCPWPGNGAALSVITGLSDDCDTTQMGIAPLDEARLDRLHRFLRLWRRTGWTMWGLQLVLQTPRIGAGALDEPALGALLPFQQILDLAKLPIDVVVAWFGSIDRTPHLAPDGSAASTRYDLVFLNPALPQDPAFQLAGDGNSNPPAKLADHLFFLGAALGVTPADATLLVSLTDGSLNLANLSLIYSVTTLAGVAGLSITDLLGLLAIENTTITELFSKPASTLAFLKHAATLKQSGFTIPALTYVLTTSPGTAGLTEVQLTTVLTSVQAAIQAVSSAIFKTTNPPVTVKPPLTVLQTELAQLPVFADPTLLANTIAVVGGTFAGTPDDAAAVIAAITTFMMPAAAAAALYLPLHASASDPAGTLAEVGTRALAILAPLAVAQTQKQVTAAVASGLQLTPDIAALLLGQVNVPGTTTTLLASLTDPGLIAPGASPYTLALTPVNYPGQFNALRLLDKVATVVNKLNLVAVDLAWLLTNAAVYDGLDFTQLPVLATQPSIVASKLANTVLVVQLNRAFTSAANSTASPPPAYQSLFALIAAIQTGALTTVPDIQAALAVITGWLPADIANLAGALGAALTPANDYLAPNTYDRLRTLTDMVAGTGGTGAQLVTWGGAAPDGTAAQSAWRALKARHNNEAWLKVAPHIMNPLRERRNVALISHLLAQKDAKGAPVWGADANALVDHFLIDVQMTSCEVSTRIVQAYASVQMFVQRCLMNLEPGITLDPAELDDGWNEWDWMQRFQLWVANRKVFLYPENWLIGTQRPNSSELFQKLTQEVHQQENVSDNFETILLNYLDRLDGIAHLRVTGTCISDGTTYVVARTVSDPPTYYLRSLADNIWTSWEQIPLSIKVHQVTPEVYAGNLFLFWPQITTANEPQQSLPPAIQSASSTPSQSPPPAQHVEITLGFSVRRNGNWTPMQLSQGKLYDLPLLDPRAVSHGDALESLYTLKTVLDGSWLYLDVFRLGGGDFGEGNTAYDYYWNKNDQLVLEIDPTRAIHVGRAKFDGRFNDLLQRNLLVFVNANLVNGVLAKDGGWLQAALLERAQAYYGPDAQSLLPLPGNEIAPNLRSEPGLEPRAGTLASLARSSNGAATQKLNFTSEGAIELFVGPLLGTAPLPFRVVGPNLAYSFIPMLDFFYLDNQRSYFVRPSIEPAKHGHFWIGYNFNRFYHPYTRLLWHELSSGGISALYNPQIQYAPDATVAGKADVFSFSKTYQPVAGRTSHGENNEIMDFSPGAAYSVYNWELFYHIPLYIAQQLSQNQQFEDARNWFHYIFNPTSPGKDPIPQRYWIPKPLHSLTASDVQQQGVNQLLQLVTAKNADADAQVAVWRKHPYDPYAIADQRPVAYMKNVFMSYLDNLIAWADNLFSTESREALNEATMLYVLASEILGPKPQAVTPPAAVEESFDQMLPKLDAFGDALAEVENVWPRVVSARPVKGRKGKLSAPQTFYFKIPPNDQLLGYWDTLADRLYKLRHCQNLQGQHLDLALFDSPIDPGLLTAGRAAGADLGSILNDVSSPLPNYRFAGCYAQAMDFCSAVRAYGASLQAALEKSDADQLSLLMATTQRQLLADANQMYQMKVDQAQTLIDAATQAKALADNRQAYYSGLDFMNVSEGIAGTLMNGAALTQALMTALKGAAAVTSAIPTITLGASGFGGSPCAIATIEPAAVPKQASKVPEVLAAIFTTAAKITDTMATYQRRQEGWSQTAAESAIQSAQAQKQIDSATLTLQMAQLDQQNHQSAIDNLNQQIDFLKRRFSNQELYDWMVSKLSDTYFQSYRLAYAMSKRAERCYRYELGLLDSSFISFGYWDSLKKGLLSGEALNHDLRRMQASYYDLNVRRFEISRIISLSVVDPVNLFKLIQTGQCDFNLPETLFDGDYPGHYQRRITRVSVTVVYPNPGKNDNVKCTLTLVNNSVRLTNDLNPQYPRSTGKDPRFTDSFGAVQSIVTGNAQDDPGLFINTISANIADQRYLPFEGAGCISSWHLELPALTNDIDLTTVGDVLIHVYYTALDGGSQFKQAAQSALPVPTQGVKLFSAQNDFGAGSAAYAPTAAQGPVATPWQAFTTLSTPPTDQVLKLNVAASKFPNWTRGKTITITSLTFYVVSSTGGSFVLEAQPPLQAAPTPPQTLTDITLNPVPGYPGVATGTVTLPSGTAPGPWSFKLRQSTATDWQSLKGTQLGDVVLLVGYTAS